MVLPVHVRGGRGDDRLRRRGRALRAWCVPHLLHLHHRLHLPRRRPLDLGLGGHDVRVQHRRQPNPRRLHRFRWLGRRAHDRRHRRARRRRHARPAHRPLRRQRLPRAHAGPQLGAADPRRLHPLGRMVRLQRRLDALRLRARRAVRARSRARVRDHHPLRGGVRPLGRRLHLPHDARVGRDGCRQRRARRPCLHHRGLRRRRPVGGDHHGPARLLRVHGRVQAHDQAQDRRPPRCLRRPRRVRLLGRARGRRVRAPGVRLQRRRPPRLLLRRRRIAYRRADRRAHHRARLGEHHVGHHVRRAQGRGHAPCAD
mmetsp:Transcript_6322/g.16157  ORF Transcript_6322/g.16157 Transcript_6322/m.16157 type:complete len:313 (-) Transcript_6322:520-1458(-)